MKFVDVLINGTVSQDFLAYNNSIADVLVFQDRTARPKNFRPKHFKTADYALIKQKQAIRSKNERFSQKIGIFYVFF